MYVYICLYICIKLRLHVQICMYIYMYVQYNEKMIGSVMILQFENDEKMQEWYDNEPYIKDGVWKFVEVMPFRVANI